MEKSAGRNTKYFQPSALRLRRCHFDQAFDCSVGNAVARTSTAARAGCRIRMRSRLRQPVRHMADRERETMDGQSLTMAAFRRSGVTDFAWTRFAGMDRGCISAAENPAA